MKKKKLIKIDYVLYFAFIKCVLLNVLIAMMDHIQEESEHNHNEWIRQVKIILS